MMTNGPPNDGARPCSDVVRRPAALSRLGLVGLCLGPLWILLTFVHVVEIENRTSHEVSGVRLAGAGREILVGAIAPGKSAKKVFFRATRHEGGITVYFTEANGARVVGRCGYIDLAPTKHRIRLGVRGVDDCSGTSRLVGWPW